MSIEWATADDSAELVTEPGEIQDERGNRNDGAALWIAPRGTDAGVVVEGALPELAAWLSRALLQVRAAAGPDLGEAPDEPTALVLLSRWTDDMLSPAAIAAPSGAGTLALRMAHLGKISRAAAEVIPIYIAESGQRTATATLDKLLEVAITALGAYEALTGHEGRALHALDAAIVSTARRVGVVQ